MNEKEIFERSGGRCEICGGGDNVGIYEVYKSENSDGYALLCEKCLTAIESQNFDENRFVNALNNSMWSEVPGVKILSYRIWKALGRNDMADMIYLSDEEMAVAEKKEQSVKDSNGNVLKAGDSVSVIKDLDVKGTSKTIKRGTLVKNIKMCDVEGHVSCRVEGIGQVYLKTEFLKKV